MNGKKVFYSRWEARAFGVEENRSVVAQITALDAIRHEMEMLESLRLALGRLFLPSHAHLMVCVCVCVCVRE